MISSRFAHLKKVANGDGRGVVISYFGVRRQSAAATAFWIESLAITEPKRRRRCALPAHSKCGRFYIDSRLLTK